MRKSYLNEYDIWIERSFTINFISLNVAFRLLTLPFMIVLGLLDWMRGVKTNEWDIK